MYPHISPWKATENYSATCKPTKTAFNYGPNLKMFKINMGRFELNFKRLNKPQVFLPLAPSSFCFHFHLFQKTALNVQIAYF